MDDLASDLRHAASDVWPEYGWNTATVLHGAFHIVVVPADADVVLRAATGIDFRARCLREAAIIRTMADAGLQIAVPKLLSDPLVSGDWAAVLISRLPGSPRQGDDLDPPPINDYRWLLSGFRVVDPATLTGLPAPRSWCGGEDWPDLVRRDLLRLLPGSARRAACERVDDLLLVEATDKLSLCHGDFGPHNILWRNHEPSGLIDGDHACLGDPAIDLAPLIGFHGVEALRQLVELPLLRRSMVHRATLSLQVAAAAHLIGATKLRDHALGNFVNRWRHGTLFDPGGRGLAELPTG